MNKDILNQRGVSVREKNVSACTLPRAATASRAARLCLALAGLCGLSSGCGGRTGLLAALEPDAGIFDAGTTDAGRALELECMAQETRLPLGMPIRIEATIDGDRAVLSQAWSVMEAPEHSRATPLPLDRSVADFTADRPGDYRLRFTVQDALGAVAFCEISLAAEDGPPLALCPESPRLGRPGIALVLEAMGRDDHAILRQGWRVLEAPPGADPSLTPDDAMRTTFVGDLRGIYQVEFFVEDPEGNRGTCVVEVELLAELSAACSPEHARVAVGVAVALRASASSDEQVTSAEWQIVERPAGSMVMPTPRARARSELRPDQEGRYLVQYRVTSVTGLTASCEVAIDAIVPPALICPSRVLATPLLPVEITAAVAPGRLDTITWTLSERPPGSSTAPPEPANERRTRITPDALGDYLLTAEARLTDGRVEHCQVRVSAESDDGLRIEMWWDTPGSDMDVHLLREEADRWDSPGDCYYQNCSLEPLRWYGDATEQNPRIDQDLRIIHPPGPEILHITLPHAATYRVGVVAFAGAANAYARIHCGPPALRLTRTLGPVYLQPDDPGAHRSSAFWRVADVMINGDGTCHIIDLSLGGEPWVTSQYDASRSR